MTISVARETMIFLGCAACGMVLGLLFDILRISRRVVKTGNFIVMIEDLLFWLVASFFVFVSIFYLNDGELRWYEFFGIALGSGFYMLAFSPWILKVSVYVLNFFKKLMIWIIKILFAPFKFIAKLLRRPMLFVFNFSRRKAKTISGKAHQGLKNCRKIFKKI